MPAKWICTVLTPLEIAPGSVLEIIPGHLLRRPDADELSAIKDQISTLVAGPGSPFFLYECQKPPQGVENPEATNQVLALEPSSWNYSIVEFEGPGNESLRPLGVALALAKREIELGFQFTKSAEEGIVIFHPASLHSFFDAARITWIEPLAVDEPLAAEVRALHGDLKSLEIHFPEFLHAFWNFQDLKAIPRFSEVVVLLLVAIVESLLTHRPKTSDNYDSLTHQVSSKMVLLHRRFDDPLEVNGWFHGLDVAGAWKRIYAYRSMVAHGDKIDFEKPDLKALGNAINVREFLYEATRRALRLCLSEPQLVRDLKNC